MCQELNGALPTRPQRSSENGEPAYHDNYHEYREDLFPKPRVTGVVLTRKYGNEAAMFRVG